MSRIGAEMRGEHGPVTSAAGEETPRNTDTARDLEPRVRGTNIEVVPNPDTLATQRAASTNVSGPKAGFSMVFVDGESPGVEWRGEHPLDLNLSEPV